jgi:hypothetical protein
VTAARVYILWPPGYLAAAAGGVVLYDVSVSVSSPHGGRVSVCVVVWSVDIHKALVRVCCVVASM